MRDRHGARRARASSRTRRPPRQHPGRAALAGDGEAGVDARRQSLRVRLGREREQRHEVVEAAKRAGAVRPRARGLESQRVNAQLAPTSAHLGHQLQQLEREALAVSAPTRSDRLGKQASGVHADVDPGQLAVAGSGVRNERIRDVLQICAVAEREAQLVHRRRPVGAVQLGRRLRGEVDARARIEDHTRRQAIACEHAAGRILDIHECHVGRGSIRVHRRRDSKREPLAARAQRAAPARATAERQLEQPLDRVAR